MVSLAVIVLEMLVDHTSQMLFSEKDHSISWRYRSAGSFPLLGAMVALGLVSRVIVTSPVKVLLGCACAPHLDRRVGFAAVFGSGIVPCSYAWAGLR